MAFGFGFVGCTEVDSRHGVTARIDVIAKNACPVYKSLLLRSGWNTPTAIRHFAAFIILLRHNTGT